MGYQSLPATSVLKQPKGTFLHPYQVLSRPRCATRRLERWMHTLGRCMQCEREPAQMLGTETELPNSPTLTSYLHNCTREQPSGNCPEPRTRTTVTLRPRSIPILLPPSTTGPTHDLYTRAVLSSTTVGIHQPGILQRAYCARDRYMQTIPPIITALKQCATPALVTINCRRLAEATLSPWIELAPHDPLDSDQVGQLLFKRKQSNERNCFVLETALNYLQENGLTGKSRARSAETSDA